VRFTAFLRAIPHNGAACHSEYSGFAYAHVVIVDMNFATLAERLRSAF